jgi:tRNA-specific 2-thiouridylase
VPDGDYSSFIESYTGETFEPGNFVDSSGKVLGRHNGIARYTIGQRKGLGLSFPQPMYVKSINPADNTVELCVNEELFSTSLTAVDFNWISCDGAPEPIRVKAKIRYNHREEISTVTQLSDESVRIEFDAPQRAIARGQAVVIYDGDVVIGGGTIV